MSDVEKRIEEANPYSNENNNYERNCFRRGAHFGIQLGREAMLSEVLEYMKSADAENFEEYEYNSAREWAQVLESKFKGKT